MNEKYKTVLVSAAAAAVAGVGTYFGLSYYAPAWSDPQNAAASVGASGVIGGIAYIIMSKRQPETPETPETPDYSQFRFNAVRAPVMLYRPESQKRLEADPAMSGW